MPEPKTFLEAVDRRMQPKTDYLAPSKSKVAYGYPVKTSEELGLDEYFKNNPDVAGMAWGGGANDSDPKEPRSVVHNPYNKAMQDETRREALYKLEAGRHLMDEYPVGDYPIPPELQKWRELTFTEGMPYRDDDKVFRETVVSRILAGDSGPDDKNPMPFTPEAKALADRYNELLAQRESPTENFLDAVESGIRKKGAKVPEPKR
jgi:hypothetical protein